MPRRDAALSKVVQVVMKYNRHIGALRTAMMRLRVYEQNWIDLSYPLGDPRAVIPDSEQPAHRITERARLQREVVRLAALVGNASIDEAAMFADAPHAPDNPFNLRRVRVAASLAWRL